MNLTGTTTPGHGWPGSYNNKVVLCSLDAVKCLIQHTPFFFDVRNLIPPIGDTTQRILSLADMSNWQIVGNVSHQEVLEMIALFAAIFGSLFVF